MNLAEYVDLSILPLLFVLLSSWFPPCHYDRLPSNSLFPSAPSGGSGYEHLLTLLSSYDSLNTESGTVRARLVQHLNDLLSLGVGGLRIDAAKRTYFSFLAPFPLLSFHPPFRLYSPNE